MISDTLSEAIESIKRYMFEDDRGYSKNPDLCDQIWQCLQDMEALRVRLDSPDETHPNLGLSGLVRPTVAEYLQNGNSVAFKTLFERVAQHIGAV